MLTPIFPKPIQYYQTLAFEGERAGPYMPDTDLSRITLLTDDAAEHERILSQLKTVRFRRHGRLNGEYAMINGGMLALDRNGTPIKFNCDHDDDWAHNSLFSQLESLCASPEFEAHQRHIVDNWDSLPSIGETPFLAEPYSARNYYHFSMVFLPRVRHFADAPTTLIAMPKAYLDYAFQRDLITLTYGARRIVPTPEIFRITNPIGRYEPFGVENVRWLRETIPHRARLGERKIYITRRSTMVGRHHGTVREDAAFLAFLDKHGFEAVDFGAGEISVTQQIELLSGARVIMSAHGANLTNIVYAESGISVIEMLPYFWADFAYMRISAAAGLNYFGIVCHDIDEDRRLRPDLKLLSQTLEAALDATPAREKMAV
jgi:hypothetical protein